MSDERCVYTTLYRLYVQQAADHSVLRRATRPITAHTQNIKPFPGTLTGKCKTRKSSTFYRERASPSIDSKIWVILCKTFKVSCDCGPQCRAKMLTSSRQVWRSSFFLIRNIFHAYIVFDKKIVKPTTPYMRSLCTAADRETWT